MYTNSTLNLGVEEDGASSQSTFFLRIEGTFPKYFISLALLCMLGCSATPSKEGTALDHIKRDLKQASIANKNLKPIKLPSAVEDSLKPQLEITTVLDVLC